MIRKPSRECQPTLGGPVRQRKVEFGARLISFDGVSILASQSTNSRSSRSKRWQYRYSAHAAYILSSVFKELWISEAIGFLESGNSGGSSTRSREGPGVMFKRQTVSCRRLCRRTTRLVGRATAGLRPQCGSESTSLRSGRFVPVGRRSTLTLDRPECNLSHPDFGGLRRKVRFRRPIDQLGLVSSRRPRRQRRRALSARCGVEAAARSTPGLPGPAIVAATCDAEAHDRFRHRHRRIDR